LSCDVDSFDAASGRSLPHSTAGSPVGGIDHDWEVVDAAVADDAIIGVVGTASGGGSWIQRMSRSLVPR
jgi:hypothetical protein